MEKTIKIKSPQVSEWLYPEDKPTGQKQDGMQNRQNGRFHISELTPAEALEYAREHQEEFLKKYHEAVNIPQTE